MLDYVHLTNFLIIIIIIISGSSKQNVTIICGKNEQVFGTTKKRWSKCQKKFKIKRMLIVHFDQFLNIDMRTCNGPDNSTAVFITNVRDDVEVRSPELKFSLPVNDCRQRSTHQEWTFTMTLSQ